MIDPSLIAALFEQLKAELAATVVAEIRAELRATTAPAGPVNRKNVRERYGIPPRMFDDACRAGEIVNKKLGHSRVATPQAVEAWLAKRPAPVLRSVPPTEESAEQLYERLSRTG